MKKFLFALALSSMSFIAFAQSADSNKSDSKTEYYAKYIPVDNIATHVLGYKVWYRDNSGLEKVAYLPTKWFTGTGAGTKDGVKGFVLYQKSTTPYIQVFYKDGKFSYVKLVMDPNPFSDKGNWRLINSPMDWHETPTNPSGEEKTYQVGDLQSLFDTDDLKVTE